MPLTSLNHGQDRTIEHIDPCDANPNHTHANHAHANHADPHPISQAGFTLVELVIALTLALLVTGATYTLLHQHQRFHRDLDAVLTTRTRTQDATTILAAELRDASINDSLLLATDTAVELFTTVGVGVVCAVPSASPGKTLIELTPDSSTGIAPSTFRSPPDSLDAASLFHDSTTLTPTRGWLRAPVTHAARPLAKSTCPVTTGFTTHTDISAARRTYEFLLATAITPAPHPGTPVRIIRRARYSLYKASDALWYLGYRRCDIKSPTCATVQPVSGPYAGHTPPLTFRYYDVNGIERHPLTPTTTITRIDIVAHAATRAPIRFLGVSTPFVDSAVTSIALRNAP